MADELCQARAFSRRLAHLTLRPVGVLINGW